MFRIQSEMKVFISARSESAMGEPIHGLESNYARYYFNNKIHESDWFIERNIISTK